MAGADPLRTGGCISCGSATYIQGLYDEFGEKVCHSCHKQSDDYRVVSRTTAKEQFALPDSVVSELRFVERPNPTNPKFAGMKLVLLKHVRAAAIKRWGSIKAAEDESRKRQAAKLDRAAKKNRSVPAAPKTIASLAAAVEGKLQSTDNKPVSSSLEKLADAFGIALVPSSIGAKPISSSAPTARTSSSSAVSRLPSSRIGAKRPRNDNISSKPPSPQKPKVSDIEGDYEEF